MASEKQIAANRANALLSTGPKTAAGRLKSSRNAVRHGLSNPVWLDPAAAEKIDTMASILNSVGETDRSAANEVAHAQLALLRIRATRAEMMGAVDMERLELQSLRRLAALDRYERYAHTRRRRAAQKLYVHHVDPT